MLSADGIFIVVATISEQDGRSVAPPELIFRGVPFIEGDAELLDELRGAVDDSLAKSAEEEIREIDLLQAHLHDDIAKFVYDRLQAPADGAAGGGRGLAPQRSARRTLARWRELGGSSRQRWSLRSAWSPRAGDDGGRQKPQAPGPDPDVPQQALDSRGGRSSPDPVLQALRNARVPARSRGKLALCDEARAPLLALPDATGSRHGGSRDG